MGHQLAVHLQRFNEHLGWSVVLQAEWSKLERGHDAKQHESSTHVCKWYNYLHQPWLHFQSDQSCRIGHLVDFNFLNLKQRCTVLLLQLNYKWTYHSEHIEGSHNCSQHHTVQ